MTKNNRTKTCIDCGKELVTEFYESNDVVCNDCVQLLKRQFWSSVKMSMTDKKLQQESKEKQKRNDI
jgi:transcription initiation factor TFIIIB Brf1 subunit/transcription initiation factor TFIIB